MKLSYGQMCIILLLYRVLIIMSSTQPYCAAWMAGSAISVAVQFLIILPLISMTKKRTVFNFQGKRNIIFSVFFIILGAFTFRRFIGVINPGEISVSKGIVTVMLLTAASVYCAGCTLRAAGRCAVIVNGIFVFSLAVLIAGAYKGIRGDNMLNMSGTDGIINYAVSDFAQSGELILIFVLSALTEKKVRRGINLYFLLKLVLTQGIVFLGMSVVGKLSDYVEYPFFALCSFSSPFNVQRSDALFIMVYSLVCIVNISVDIMIASEILKKFMKRSRCLSGIIMAAGGYALSFIRYDTVMTEAIITAVFLIAAYIVTAAGSSAGASPKNVLSEKEVHG